MQTKKEDIKEQIQKAAQSEFLIHGYEGASMRVIARQAYVCEVRSESRHPHPFEPGNYHDETGL